MNKLASTIDHTNLKPDSGRADIEKLCIEAVEFGFASVCVLPYYVEFASQLLKKEKPKICTVIGFPLGNAFTTAKTIESDVAILKGAEELDMVMNIAAFKNKDFHLVEEDIAEVVNLAQHDNVTVKVIVEACLLTEEEKITVCKIVSSSGADYIKTSTGFSTGGAVLEDILLFRNNIDENIKIKAAGGIKTAKFAMELIGAGATRIGTSSGVQIMKELI